jgi:hypothetical protein
MTVDRKWRIQTKLFLRDIILNHLYIFIITLFRHYVSLEYHEDMKSRMHSYQSV